MIGTVAGLIAGFVLTAPQVEPAEEAVADLTRAMADPLDRMVAGLNDGSVNDSARAWLDQARALGNEIRRVDEAAASAARVAQAYKVIGSTGPERDDRYTRRYICRSRAATRTLVPAGCGPDGTGTTAVSKSSSHCSPQGPPGSTNVTSS